MDCAQTISGSSPLYYCTRTCLDVCGRMEIVWRVCMDDLQGDKRRFENEEALLDLPGTNFRWNTNSCCPANQSFKIYIALLKFDFLFFLGFTIQFVVIVVQDKRSVEFGLTLAAIPVTITIIFLAGLFTRKESKVGMFAIIVSQSQFCGMDNR